MSQQSSRSDDGATGGDLPPGAVLGDPSADSLDSSALIDNAGDLGYTTERLQLREQELLAEYERNARMLRNIGTDAGDVVGHGEGADGAVTIETDAANRMTDLQLDPRALRLGSIDNLRKAILEAYEGATEDVATQLREAGLDDVPKDPVRAMLDSMPELTAIMPDHTWAPFLETPEEPEPQRRRPDARGERRDWEERNPYG